MTLMPSDQPRPITVDWRAQGSCAGLPPELFYTDHPHPDATAACAICPVQADCYQYALHHERYGYWAGTSEHQRRRLRREQGIVLPRANEANDVIRERLARLDDGTRSVPEIASVAGVSERAVYRHRALRGGVA